ncbi:unnamed protein product [Clonostachys solani]|uniref:Heterokaryon incompatibility domain-containing protein n=1 Tax=Clonostachys solani TaxID=160281 RepID=A0A9P0EP63_9HYPO|nr:unnamed protein product [Clonostachys solani]
MAAPYLMEIAAAAAPAPSTNSTRMVVLMGGPIAAGHIDVSGCGLQSRGWVFQEGLCSPRGLYISRRHGLWWDCRTMVDAIDASEPIMTGDTDHAFNPRTLRRSFPQAEPPANSLHQNLSFNWYDWIMSYTLRNLTRQPDRLPAVAGLASYAFSLSGMTYAAGLWKEDILRGLTWRRGNSGYAERAPGNAPTWSWASVTGPIHYDEFFTMRVDHRGEIKKRPKLDLEITGTTIHEVRPGTFGNVQGGEIEATGILRNAATMLVGTGLSADWYLDLQPAGEENQFLESCQVLRLAMAYRNKQNSKPQVYFLIVRKTGEGVNEYQRVGRGYIELRGRPSPKSELPEQGIWEQAERVTLTLV